MTVLDKTILPHYFAALQGVTQAAVSLTFAFGTIFSLHIIIADTTLHV